MTNLVSVAPRTGKGKTNKEAIRRAILGELNRIFHDRYGPEFPDDSAGREDLEILLRLHALHPTHGRERVKNAIETRAPWLATEAAEILIDDFANMDPRRFWGPWWRDELKLAMNLTTADRERLRAWHIPPIDKSDAELARYRQDRKNAKQRNKRREAGVRPRSIYRLKSKSTKKPWEALGISKATYYRHGYHRETSVKLSLVDPKESRSKHQSHRRETSEGTAKKALRASDLSHTPHESQMKGNSYE